MSRVMAVLTGKEIAEAFRSRWLAGFVIGFVALGALLTLAGSWGAAFGGAAGFGRTSAALVNLVLLIVPLMGLLAGALALAAERERRTMEFLLALPVRRTQVFWAKFLGAGWALGAALSLAFGLLAVYLTAQDGLGGSGGFLACFAATLLLAAVSLGLGLMISALTTRIAPAVGAALLVWLLFVFAGDLGLLGTSLAVRLPPAVLLGAAWLNPLSLYRLLAIDLVAAGLDVLGPAGRCAVDSLGTWLRPLALAGLAAWLGTTLAAARFLFLRRPMGAGA